MEAGLPASLRLFVAIELPDDVRAALDATARALERAGVGDAARWVRAEGVHITLKFLGQTAPSLVPEISAALEPAVRDVTSFTLQPGGVGAFGGRRNLRVIWVGVAGETLALGALAVRVEQALAPLGFPSEQRAFTAHLTLARIRDGTRPAERERIASLLDAFRAPLMPSFGAERVSLMQSVPGRGGASYRALTVFPLQ